MNEIQNYPEQTAGSESSGGAVPAAGGWLETLPEDLAELARLKGWKEPAEAVESYKNLQSLVSAERDGRTLVKPRDENDHEAYERLYQALGRPPEPAGYELEQVLNGEGGDGRFMETMGRSMHEAGLSKAQGLALARAYQNYCQQLSLELEHKYQSQVDYLAETLPPEDLEAARRGIRLSGAPAPVIAQLEKALGPAQAVEIFANIGRRLAEDSLSGQAQALGDGGPDAAARRIAELRADPAFRQRYLSGESAAVSQLSQLYRQAAGS